LIHIGLYLSTEPQGGGTYQYNLSIISALELLEKSEYKITVFCHNKDWCFILPRNFNIVLKKKYIFLSGLARIYRMIDTSTESLRRFATFFYPIVKTVNLSDCDIIICPSQDALSYQTTKKVLSTIHDLMHKYESSFDEYKNGEYDRREKHYSMMCKYARGILVDSKIGKSQVLESYSIDQEKVLILPFVPPLYLLQTQTVDVKLKYSLPDDYLFYPAQFWEHKNHLNLLGALKILKDKNIFINLVLVGSKKNNYEKVVAETNTLGLIDSVFFLGYVNNNDMASLYRKSLATIFVSHSGPTNIPPVEALTLGSPLICSNVYAMPTQVGNAALFVDPKNKNDMAEKIRAIVESPDLSASLVEKGYIKIKEYSQTDFSGKLLKYIRSTLIS